MKNEQVLVTGGSGFLGSHCIVKLLQAGYPVRTTIRSLAKEPQVREMVRVGGAEPDDRLTVVEADLTRDEGWDSAMEGCTYVLHVASPFPVTQPRDESELIVPAVQGTLRVLRAARDEGIRRVVVTSSFAAIGYGQGNEPRTFTEEDWTDIDGPGVTAYVKSKTLAERAAWDFIEREGQGMELAVVNPVAILGPVLSGDYAASIQLVQRLMNGSMPAAPRVTFGIVDVRDVADLELRAMTSPEAAGERFLAVSGDPVSMPEAARVLRANLGAAASKVPKRTMPDWMVRILALFVPPLRAVVAQLGRVARPSNAKARRVLGWEPRSTSDAIIASGESLIRFDQV